MDVGERLGDILQPLQCGVRSDYPTPWPRYPSLKNVVQSESMRNLRVTNLSRRDFSCCAFAQRKCVRSAEWM
ncbi:hypothetical protein IG631_10709 [Alternaria alternata]|nr:hypothetical protein IG631_10709 [Alternaria alternata]